MNKIDYICKCEVCHKKFYGFRIGQKACSDTCRAELIRRHNREYRLKHIEEIRSHDRQRAMKKYLADPDKERARQRDKYRRLYSKRSGK